VTDEELKDLFDGLRRDGVETRQQIETTAARTEQRVDERLETFAARIEQRVDERLETFAARIGQRVDERLETFAAGLEQRVDAKLSAATDDMRRHFDTAVEEMKGTVQLLAESIGSVDAKLDRSVVALREEIRSTAAETQAMIRFSHSDLDRRVRTLEDSVSDLKTRMERVEATTR
jgi:hypothetical protein